MTRAKIATLCTSQSSVTRRRPALKPGSGYHPRRESGRRRFLTAPSRCTPTRTILATLSKRSIARRCARPDGLSAVSGRS